jgi:hypothetical protein
MAITGTVTYSGQAPVAGGSSTLAFGGTSMLETSYVAIVTLTLDGAATTFTFKYVSDGTTALPFTPAGFLWSKSGGTESTAAVVKIVDNADGGKNATITLSAAGTNTNTLIYAVMILK